MISCRWRSSIRTHGRGSLLHRTTHHLRKMARVECATLVRRLQLDEIIKDRIATGPPSPNSSFIQSGSNGPRPVLHRGVCACKLRLECGSDAFSCVTPLGEPVLECQILCLFVPDS